MEIRRKGMRAMLQCTQQSVLLVLQAGGVAAPHTTCGDLTYRSNQIISNGHGQLLQLACTLTVWRRLLITGRSASRAFMVSAMLQGRTGLRGAGQQGNKRARRQEGARRDQVRLGRVGAAGI